MACGMGGGLGGWLMDGHTDSRLAGDQMDGGIIRHVDNQWMWVGSWVCGWREGSLSEWMDDWLGEWLKRRMVR